MFDIDIYLDDIAIKEVSPSDTLINTTMEKCGEVLKNREKEIRLFKQIKKTAFIALPAAAMLLIGILIGSQFFGGAQTAVAEAAVACFTVDINPSVCVNVDEDNIVTGLSAQNDDARELISKLNCVGMTAADAIYRIVEQAMTDGFLSEANKYVLIGCFGVSNEDDTLGSLQERLEQDFGEMINLLIVSGTLDDKSEADALEVSAGLLKLSRLAQGIELKNGDKVEDVVDEMGNNYSAPILSIKEKTDGLHLKWSKLDFSRIGFSGKVLVEVVAADSAAKIESFGAKVIKTYSYEAGGSQTTECTLTPENSGISAGTVKYYGVYIKFGDMEKLSSNAVSAKMPEITEPAATPKPSSSATAPPSGSPSQAPQPSSDAAVSGSVSGNAVALKWRRDTADNFAGYKVVASKTNPTPKYPDDGYIKYITNRDTTSAKLYEGDGGLKAGQSYYFSVTYLYGDGSARAANAVQLTVPKKTETADPGATPSPSGAGDYPATNVGGSMSGTTARLSWSKISDSRLDGYKVVCSFTDSTPCYPDNGYVYWITDADKTSCSIEMTGISGYSSGRTCYFAITALYDGHSVKKTGRVLPLSMPSDGSTPPPPEETPAPPAADYASTNIGGSMDGTVARLSWGSISDSRLEGYKVVCSFSDSTPCYPDNGYVYWITDGRTSCSIEMTSRTGYAPGATCWYAITAVYKDGTKRTGRVLPLTMPPPPDPTATPDPAPTETPLPPESEPPSPSGS